MSNPDQILYRAHQQMIVALKSALVIYSGWEENLGENASAKRRLFTAQINDLIAKYGITKSEWILLISLWHHEMLEDILMVTEEFTELQKMFNTTPPEKR